MTKRAFAPAKVNLFLHVGAPGADGYHPICSLMAFADVGDVVMAYEAEALEVRVNGPFAKDLERAGGEGLMARAARALIAEARLHVLVWSAAYRDEGRLREITCDLGWRSRRAETYEPAFVPALAKRTGIERIEWNPHSADVTPR